MQRLLLHLVHIHCQHCGAQVSRSRKLTIECLMPRSRFRCKVNACDHTNGSYNEPWLNFTIPQYNGNWDQCVHFRAISETDGSCVAGAFNRNQSDSCEASYIFRDSENTISTEVIFYYEFI